MRQSDPRSADLAVSTGSLLLFAPPLRTEALRYAVAASIVLAIIAAGTSILRAPFRMPEQMSETDNVVMVDLPPADTASAPLREAADGPEEAASQAAPDISAPPVEQPRPSEDPRPPTLDAPVAEKPPPEAPKPEATLDAKKEGPARPRPIAAAPAPQVEEQAPQGAEHPKDSKDADADSEAPHASAQALSVWQRSMISKLETAKKSFRRHGGREGTVRVAFSIDRDGRLVSEHVDISSGDTLLDDMAKRVVRKAEPYPTPPAGARDQDLLFTVPIRFRR